MSSVDRDSDGEHFLEVDRTEFLMRLNAFANLDGVGRVPISIRYDGESLIITQGCVIRIRATGNWPEEATFSKAELKRFVKNSRKPPSVNTFGENRRAIVKRLVSVLDKPPTMLSLARQGETTLLIDGQPVTRNWSSVN